MLFCEVPDRLSFVFQISLKTIYLILQNSKVVGRLVFLRVRVVDRLVVGRHIVVRVSVILSYPSFHYKSNHDCSYSSEDGAEAF